MDDKTETLAARLVLDDAGARKLGSDMAAKFKRYESDRRQAELKYARNARQYLGIYDPEVESRMDPSKSKAYPKLTRVKCVSMLSRLMNLLFPTDDKNWTVTPSAVPELSTPDLQKVLNQVAAAAQVSDPPRAVTSQEIEIEIRKVAETRAARLALEIEDQLQELGGNKTADYVALSRKVLASGIQYGMGVLKGPYVATTKQRQWTTNPQGQLVPDVKDVERPRYAFVSIWDYYPDMTAKTFEQMEGQFERAVLSKHKLEELKERSDFLSNQIDKVIAAHPNGNYIRRAFETDLRAMGVQLDVQESETNKYEAIVWEGYVSGKMLFKVGLDVLPAQRKMDIRAVVWTVGEIPIKIEIDPWTVLLAEEAPAMYHHFIFEEDESSIIGNGLPNIMRDSQMGVCAGARMVMDNGSIACGLNLEINTALLMPGQDVTNITGNQIYYRDDENPATIQIPAVKAIELPSRVNELKTIIDLFSGFADQETFVNAATGGDIQKGPSEPFRTAAGASMMKGDAALPFKDVVRNFDMFTQSVIGSIIAFNKQFNKNPDVQGDFQAVARGATSLIAKEVLGIQLDNLAATLTEEEKMFVDMYELAKARVRVRDLEVGTIIVTKDEADKRIAASAAKQEAQEAQQSKMIEAQVREILAVTLKNISQAGKNAAAAEATSANVILNALEKGISPDAIANTSGGATTPDQSTPVQGGPGAESGNGLPTVQTEPVPSAFPEGPGGAAARIAAGGGNAGFASGPVQ